MAATKTKTRTINDNTSFHFSFANADAIVLSPATASSGSAAALPKGTYRVVANTNCWIKTGATLPTASAATGSMYVPANVPFNMQLTGAEWVACIRDTADGKLSLTRVD